MKTVIDSSLNYPFPDNLSSTTTETKIIVLENAKYKESRHIFQSSVISLLILLDTHGKLSLGTNLKVNMVLFSASFCRRKLCFNYASNRRPFSSPLLFISLFLPLLYLHFYFFPSSSFCFPPFPSGVLEYIQLRYRFLSVHDS